MKIVFLTIAAVMGLAHGADNTAFKKPNVVFILADDLGYGDVGFHDPSIYSPVIDQLAREGVKLENYYVQPMCSPTRGQFLTGRYQIHYGLVHGAISGSKQEGLPLDEVLLPQKLKGLGYNTHMVGKWHLGFSKENYMPYKRGFDTFFGFLKAGGDHYTHMGTYQGKEYLDLRDNNGPVWTENGTYSTHLYTRKALDVIKNQTADKPFFLYLAYQAPHSPIQVPVEYKWKNAHITDRSRKRLAAMVSAIDEGIGNVTSLLKQKGLWDNTLVIFCGDNGAPKAAGGRNWPYRGGKNTLFEGGMKAAAFVGGGYVRPTARGTTSKELIHVSDWFPTIVQGLAGGDATVPKALDGYNQWPTIARARATQRTALLHNIDPLEAAHGSRYNENTFDNRIAAAVRVGEMKLITGNPGLYNNWIEPTEGGPFTVPTVNDAQDKNLWLFNLTSDPYETTDLSGSQPEMVLKMLGELKKYQDTAVTPINLPLDPNSDPAKHGNVFGPWL